MSRYLEDNKIKDFVKNIIIEELYNHEDMSFYGCDLGYCLLEGYNVDGVYFYNNYDAMNFISECFEDFGEIVEEITFQLGAENIPNVFTEPDKFCVVCFLEVASYILSQCKTVDDMWDSEIELTEEVIKKLESEIKEV